MMISWGFLYSLFLDLLTRADWEFISETFESEKDD